MKLLIIGKQGGTNIGGSFLNAALQENLCVEFLEHDEAFSAPYVWRAFSWHVMGKRPPLLGRFSKKVSAFCRREKPDCILATGLAPINEEALRELERLNIIRINYLTDDPWNPSHKSSWFLKALPCYDYIFSVRRSNIHDLLSVGCKYVHYLPFGYDPELHYPENITGADQMKYASDVLFVGGGDKDRLPYIDALIRTGWKIRLYGSYWGRFRETKAVAEGQASPAAVRLATAAAKVSLCLVRRANRDGNVMRSFEIPAMGSCMLAENTEEHREIFGEEGRAVMYFGSIDEMVQKTGYLLAHEHKRLQLAKAARELIIQGRHTYGDRLKAMMKHVSAEGLPRQE